MTIKDYLSKNHITYRELAKRVGVVEQAVSLWARGKRTPRPALAEKLIAESGGQITYQDIYKIRE